MSSTPPHAAQAPAWMGAFCRTGHVAKGVVYALIGVLAIQTAVVGGSTPGSRGALAVIANQPFGSVLMALVVLGLFAYAGWRFAQAIVDVEGHGSKLVGLAKRAGIAVSGASYALLAAWGTLFLSGRTSEDGEGEWSAELMALTFGRWLVALVGVIVIGVGIGQVVRAVTDRFMRDLELHVMSDEERQAARWIGRFGIAARGITFVIMGAFPTHAAWSYDPGQARGLGGALDAITHAPFGQFLLALVAAGFVLYGLHCFARARYRTIGSVA